MIVGVQLKLNLTLKQKLSKLLQVHIMPSLYLKEKVMFMDGAKMMLVNLESVKWAIMYFHQNSSKHLILT